jgi:hypothetical protein
VKKRRRQLLKSLGITSAIGIAGCSQRLEPDNRDKSSSTEDSSDTNEQNSTDNENTSDDSDNEKQRDAEDKNNCCKYPKSGVFNIVMEDGPLGPDGVFDQGGEEETLRIPLTEEEFIKRYHANRLKKIAEKEFSGQNAKTLKELGENITDHNWIMRNVSEELPERWWGDEGPQNPFKPEVYVDENSQFDERYPKSNYPKFWRMFAHAVLGGPDSGNDYIKTAAIGATEYYSAGRVDNITFNTKTNDGTHGLGWINKVKWEPSKDQSVNVVETDPNNEEQLFDGPVYPDQTVWTEKFNSNAAKFAWLMIGSASPKLGVENPYNNINVEIEEMDKFAEALHNPGEYALKPIAVSSMLMEYLNDEAVEDGNHPELEGYNYTVKPVSGEIVAH